MKKFLTMLYRHWAKSPLKILLTLTAVALGTGILILSLSAGKLLEEEVSNRLDAKGVILYTANGSWNTEGRIEQNRPSQWDSRAIELVVSDIESIDAAAVVLTPPFGEVTTNGISYKLRSAVGTDPDYFDVFDLELAAGSPMGDDDISGGRKRVWISEDTAERLYGSAEEAVGQWIQPPGFLAGRGTGGRQQNVVTNYLVAGVFETPDEVSRRAYGIGDLLFPYTALLPSGMNVQLMLDRMAGTFVVKSTGAGAGETTASIRQVLESAYGEDIDIAVWEGSVNGESTYMEELRNTVDMFTVSVNILGIVLLLTSSLGIFSIMVVESLSRRREIALERALGASRSQVIREFWNWSLTLSLAGALLGLLLAMILSGPVMNSIAPLAGEVAGQFQAHAGIAPSAVLAALAMALGFGGVLGLLPALSAVRGNISETIREV